MLRLTHVSLCLKLLISCFVIEAAVVFVRTKRQDKRGFISHTPVNKCTVSCGRVAVFTKTAIGSH